MFPAYIRSFGEPPGRIAGRELFGWHRACVSRDFVDAGHKAISSVFQTLGWAARISEGKGRGRPIVGFDDPSPGGEKTWCALRFNGIGKTDTFWQGRRFSGDRADLPRGAGTPNAKPPQTPMAHFQYVWDGYCASSLSADRRRFRPDRRSPSDIATVGRREWFRALSANEWAPRPP